MIAKNNRRKFNTLKRLFEWAGKLGLSEKDFPDFDEFLKQELSHEAYERVMKCNNQTLQYKLPELVTHVKSCHTYSRSLNRDLRRLNKSYVSLLREKHNALKAESTKSSSAEAE